MTADPLTFPFAELEYETGDDLVRRFRAAHPSARYVVLDVHPDDVPDMLADWSAYPGSPWLTPAVENAVRAQPVAVLDSWPGAGVERLADALQLIAGERCTSFTCGHCWDQGRTRGARYGADAWCDACIARDALQSSAAELPRNPGPEQEAADATAWLQSMARCGPTELVRARARHAVEELDRLARLARVDGPVSA